MSLCCLYCGIKAGLEPILGVLLLAYATPVTVLSTTFLLRSSKVALNPEWSHTADRNNAAAGASSIALALPFAIFTTWLLHKTFKPSVPSFESMVQGFYEHALNRTTHMSKTKTSKPNRP